MRKKLFIIAGLVMTMLAMAACAPAVEAVEEEAVPMEAAEAALTLSGAVEMSWSVNDLAAMDQIEADYTNKDGETTTYSGVAISDLLAAAGVEDYTMLTLVASDEYAAEVAAEDFDSCANCLVAVQDDGSLRSVMPDMSSKVQVKDLVEIQVQ